MINSIAFVTQRPSARLSYVLDWVFKDQLGLAYEVLSEATEASSMAFVMCYGEQSGYCMPESGLLYQEGTTPQQISLGEWRGLPTLFAASTENHTIPFDLFSAIFYLISRYEEYLDYTPDKHQRFPASASILWQHDLLTRPIIDEWLAALRLELLAHGLQPRMPQFSFLPTYDIDIAWKYCHKGLQRSVGGYCKDLIRCGFSEISARTTTLLGKAQDPYDCFDWLKDLADGRQVTPLYFILAAKRNAAFDKHIVPTEKAMKQLIKRLSEQSTIGMHPSYRSSELSYILEQERQILEAITGKSVDLSRQHYIKFTLPNTYQSLCQLGIQADYSMGYGTHIGFRAGTSQAFLWYDISKEAISSLRVYPFCFMDTTAHYELNMSAQEAFKTLEMLREKLIGLGGLLVTIFHNFSLGTDKEWKGWREQYAQFYKNTTQTNQ